MASKLLQLRDRLEAKPTETVENQPETSATRKKQRDPVVVFKPKRKPAQDFHKPTSVAPVQYPAAKRYLAKPTVVMTRAEGVDRPVAPARRVLESQPDWKELRFEGHADKRAPRILEAIPQKAEAEGRLFDLCLFDLDDTLVLTEDMESIRSKGKNNNSEEYKAEVRKAFHSIKRRNIYDNELISLVRNKFPSIKMGVFTRSPRSYAQVVLGEAYSSPWWDLIVAYEDVRWTKPYGHGIQLAMSKVGVEHPGKVLMVGDGSADMRAAYHAGAIVALDRSCWPRRLVRDNWKATDLIPDMWLDRPRDLLSALEALPRFQPELERALSGFPGIPEAPRFDKINKFLPNEREPYRIYSCGRSFAKYDSLSRRREYHGLTASILENKEADVFPKEWIATIHSFIKHEMKVRDSLVVSVIPHRPGRKPRMENLLVQLKKYVSLNRFLGCECISFEPELLGYKEGVRSQSNDKLGSLERFANVRDHLFVKAPQVVDDRKRVLVIDDVCTTGSSLIYAGLRLSMAGSGGVTHLAISMNIGNVLYDD